MLGLVVSGTETRTRLGWPGNKAIEWPGNKAIVTVSDAERERN